MTYDMTDICCENAWHDYTGGADHRTIEDARKCENDRVFGTKSHVVIVPLDEYVRLVGDKS